MFTEMRAITLKFKAHRFARLAGRTLARELQVSKPVVLSGRFAPLLCNRSTAACLGLVHPGRGTVREAHRIAARFFISPQCQQAAFFSVREQVVE
jgi:hypothetical protein